MSVERSHVIAFVMVLVGFLIGSKSGELLLFQLEYVHGWWLALVIGSVIPLALIFDKKCEKRSNTRLLIDGFEPIL